MDGRTDEWMDGWMDGWKDGWMDSLTDGKEEDGKIDRIIVNYFK